MPNGGAQESSPESADAPDAEAQAVTDRSRPERFSAAPLLGASADSSCDDTTSNSGDECRQSMVLVVCDCDNPGACRNGGSLYIVNESDALGVRGSKDSSYP